MSLKKLKILFLTLSIIFLLSTSAFAGEDDYITGGVVDFSSFGYFEYGTEIDLSTIPVYPNPGYRFVGWQDDSGDFITTVTLTSDTEVYAVFEKISYMLSVETSGDGSVDDSLSGTYESGEVTVLDAVYATAGPGHTFSGYRDEIGDWVKTITMDDDRTVTAVFTPDRCAITLESNQYGVVNDSSFMRFDYGLEIDLSTVSCTPDEGYELSHWENESGETVSTTYTVQGDQTLTAVFEPVTYLLSVFCEGNGTVSTGLAGEYLENSEVILYSDLVVPDNGHLFEGFVDENGNLISSVLLNVPRQITAVFSECSSDITYFSVEGQVGETVIDESSHTVTFYMPQGSDITDLKPTLLLSPEASVLPAAEDYQDFTNPVTYTVTAGGGVDQTVWSIRCIVELAEDEEDSNSDSSNNDKDDTTSTKKEEIPFTETTTNESGSKTTTTVTTVSTNENSVAAKVSEKHIITAVNEATEEALKFDNSAAVVEIKVDAPKDAKAIETSIPIEGINAVKDNGIDDLIISTPVASISFDQNAILTLSQETEEDVSINTAVVENKTLPEDIKQKVGDRPVYDFSVESGERNITQFNGNVTVSIPYTPKPGEDSDAIVIYYINSEGELETVSNCSYNLETGTIKFKTNHLSQYVVGYNKMFFNDVAEDVWYSKAVSFIAARDITTGTGNGNFSPDNKLTRGQFIVMIMRAYGINPDETPGDNFADAGDTYYTSYLAAAKQLKISKGIGNNLFAPDKEITRQEMFTLLYNILEKVNSLPAVKSEKEISDFSDSDEIASWAMEAMNILVETKTISGSNHMLYPLSTANRAEMAQVIYNLLSK